MGFFVAVVVFLAPKMILIICLGSCNWKLLLWVSGSQSMFPGPAALVLPRSMLKKKSVFLLHSY